jgi:hypothetical protein
MKHTSHLALFNLLMALMVFSWASPLPADERYFGEPVRLQGSALYFTSWKYVRQGGFTWRVQGLTPFPFM